MKSSLYLIRTLLVTALLAISIRSEAARGFSTEKTASGITVKFNGKLFTRYVTDQANKPYLWPVIGPTGKKMTRAYPMQTVDGEQHDHPHHRSIYFGHQNTHGVDTWHEDQTWTERKLTPEKLKEKLAGLGSTVHRKFAKVESSRDHALIVTENDYLGGGKKLLADERRMRFHVGKGKHYIDFEITFIAKYGDATLGDMKDAGFSVRIPTSMAVSSKQGGTILNSRGHKDGDAWGKRAEWVDYSGPVAGEELGIAILNHPKSLRHPTPWHVRTYGLFTANPFGFRSLNKQAKEDGAVLLKRGEKIELRHRVVFHQGDAVASDIAAEFKRYAAEN
jgi:hypothetical protein